MSNLLRLLRFALIVVLLGIVVGLLGMLLGFVLHKAEYLAFGFLPGSHENYLEAIRASSPWRCVLALLFCGVLGGVGWFLLNRYGRPQASLKETINAEKPNMPGMETIANALLQIVTIGIGSPLGKEGAPRAIGVLLANRTSDRLHLNPDETRILMAACAGGGFAAMYNIPIAGALFALEVLLQGARLRWIVVAFAVSFISAITARIGLGDVHQYTIPSVPDFGWDMFVWALLAGPVFAAGALLFQHITDDARAKAPRQFWLIVCNILNFTILGFLLLFLPELAGNGRIAAQMSSDGQILPLFALVLLTGKVLVEWGSLRSGAQGGLLTPSLANGALLAQYVWTRYRHGA